MPKREIDVLVLSDIHLGTYGCHAKELLRYLKSIKPKTVVLNGDIIDIWQFSKSYWPEAHMKVVKRFMKYVSDGIPVYYLTGNHDEMLRKFTDISFGSFHLANKLVLELDGKKAWIFHGDVFDVTMQHSKWLAKLGAVGYDTLILLNSLVNWILTKLGRQKMSFSRKVKARFKDAVKFINDFENIAADLAIDKGYHYVICGHIHQAEKRLIENEAGSTLYLNSGDWVESLSALEYSNGNWQIVNYSHTDFIEEKDEETAMDNEDLKAKLNIKELLEKIKSESI